MPRIVALTVTRKNFSKFTDGPGQLVALSFPHALAAVETVSDPKEASKVRSWIQVARTGEFVSPKYGKFSITEDDLQMMLHNFNTITPKAPTKLPVDYDHLSMAPKKPGDGIAAGWMSRLELRNNGTELWAEVEWTEDGAAKVRKKEYQFVSPTFVKDYVYKDGTQIGTTLLAAAITNHPFLEGMEALTIADGSTLKNLMALSGGLLPLARPAQAISLMDVGQMVSIKEAYLRDPSQAGVSFEVVEVVGEGDDAFVSLKDANGTVYQWFRATELEPAAAEPVPPVEPPPAAPESVMPPEEPVVASDAPVRYGRRATDQPVRSMSMAEVFKLRDVKGNEVEIAQDALAAVIKPQTPALPEGSVVVLSADFEALKKSNESLTAQNSESAKQIESLTQQVTQLATTAAEEHRQSQLTQLSAILSGLSSKGFITKPERDWAEKFFGGEAINLAGLKEWAATKNTPIIRLNTEHGSGADAPQTPASTAQNLMQLADTIQSEYRQRGQMISLRDAVMEAGRRNAEMAEQYMQEFAE